MVLTINMAEINMAGNSSIMERMKLSPILNEEGGVLAILYRKILSDRGWDKEAILRSFVSSYEAKVNIDNNNTGKNIDKSTVITNMVSGKMTWKVLVHLLFSVHKFKKFRIVIETVDLYNRTHVHQTPYITPFTDKTDEMENEIQVVKNIESEKDTE